MGDEEAFVLNTQNTLGAIVKHPKLSSKLLQRPPFKFLHDVVLGFMKTTKLLDGLYTADELDPGKAAADRETKLRFLDKLVSVLQYALGETLQVKSVQVIAGREPEYTNQMLAKMAGLTSIPPNAVAAAVGKATGKDTGASPATPDRAASREKLLSREKQQSKKESDESNAPPGSSQDDRKTSSNNNAQATSSHAAVARPGTASARRPPPKVETNEVVEDRTALENSVPVAGVISEATNNNEEDGGIGGNKAGGGEEQDWKKLVEQHENAAAASRSALQQQQQGGTDAKSYLVSEAMQAKKENEAAAARARAEAEGRQGEGIVLNVKNKGDAGGIVGDSEISKLREQLQLLTKASNPLGKYLEAIFDDIDSMTRELDMWRNEARTQSTAATEAQRQTQESLREVTSQAMALDDNVGDQLQKVSVVRAQIQKNEATIEKLIRMVINPSEHRK